MQAGPHCEKICVSVEVLSFGVRGVFFHEKKMPLDHSSGC